MDPDRVRAYLQVACAGLGFDIGEIWWTNNDTGSSALAAIEERQDETNTLTAECGKKLHFVQLYTSKSYENRRNMLIKPTDEEENSNALVTAGSKPKENDSNEKHVLSPLLVDAISKTAQVVWAHTRKQEGLLGRSEMRLQTAVGMPVAVDSDGNMCVVVMFSPNNVQSTDDAMEYLQSISRSATSSSIPSLLPAFDPRQGILSLPHHHPSNEAIPLLSSPCLSDGVTTRFVSLDDAPIGSEPVSLPEVHSNHDLKDAPKDCFGIPMLPSMSEIGGNNDGLGDVHGSGGSDAFDEASYGVWSTIMENIDQPTTNSVSDQHTTEHHTYNTFQATVADDASIPVYATNTPEMAKERKDRLEEFASAFLEVSVFDVAEVWIPIGGDYLGQVTSIISTGSNESLKEFQRLGEKILIKYWSGAVGRAFSSGNPVWSANREVFVDSGRSSLFSQVKIETALAVPVFSGRAQTPSFVFCCYSFVRSGSVPFVLKFVQQALRLLWDGLDKVQPHESVGQELWKDVAPADLGEMAADVEMHEHFIIKKRPFQSISEPLQPHNATDSSLATQLEAMHVPSGVPAVRSIYTGSGPSPSPGPAEAPASPELGPTVAPVEYQTTYETIQTHINDAIRSVGYMQPVHHHVSTNAQGSKRAHVYRAPDTDQRSQYDSVSHQTQSPANNAQHYMQSPAPSPMYQPLPLPNQIMVQRASHNDEQNQAPDHGQQSQAPTINTNLNNPYQIDQNNPYHTDPNDRYQTDPNNPYQDDPNNLYQTDEFIYQNQNQQYEPEPNPVVYEYSQQPAQLQQPLQPQPTQTQPVTYYQQETNQVGASQDYSHNASYAANTIAPAPSMNTMPMPNPVASIPIDQISATGISFPVPPNMQAKPSNGIHGGVPLAQNPAAIAPSDQYCMPTSQRSKFTNTTSVSVKPCRIQGCSEPSVARRPYCVRHSGNRMCENPSCNKCAQGSTRFCIAHGGGRRCTFPGCDKGARDKFFCAAHGGGKRCKSEGCNKSAVGGSSLCTAHGGGRRCAVDGCDKSAQSSTKFCVKHGGGKKCCHPECDKVARGRTEYCAAHGGGVRCKLEGCNRVAIGKLQLCRAHGGGARPRKKQYASPPNDDPIQNPLLQPSQIQKNPMQAGYADLGGEVQMQAGFADMTSV